MAKRAAVILNKPDAHFARMLPRLIQSGSGIGRLSVFERTHGVFPTETWAFLAALDEYTGTPNVDVEELYRAPADATWRDAGGLPSVSKDYLTIFELLARVDGEESEFNIEKVFGSMMQGIERVGLGLIPEWNTLWRLLLTESLRWKASGRRHARPSTSQWRCSASTRSRRRLRSKFGQCIRREGRWLPRWPMAVSPPSPHR